MLEMRREDRDAERKGLTMVQKAPTQQKCPFPGECPHGPKREGYTCGMAFALTHGKPGDPDARVELICSQCFDSVMRFKAFLAARRAASGSGLIVPQVIPPGDILAGPGNNNGKG